ncbi:hypothetical protein PC129_g17395 [Phytophthora cactorum]|uniref:Uncharacterized protein n=1 Tax=Phytophthora cactorum TaxID=29920 RepID=A0A329RJN3_9STRA|nr:hypothetical protein Pcac1_g11885 [Phytophthora cactorum]KAG2803561.1 hypothetical protein PC111_g18633 [Phytophthora cactorum]KAG2804662.1 hypothetical protein PC112_g18617 [Phytophthora cactorum]KAG2884267.1 hypothetical protein PC114_g20191 [Phytophthora cactorum]KAG2895023.1 hypothetical protein PC115_g17981 [Phytophthora cactorum]
MIPEPPQLPYSFENLPFIPTTTDWLADISALDAR